MNESLTKKLLNYSTNLTKIAKKKLENTKTPEEKSELLSKYLIDLTKKVEELIKDKTLDSTKVDAEDSKSYIQLEFDKVNNRIDILEANNLVQRDFMMGIMDALSKASSGEDEDDEDSLVSKITKALGFGDGDGKFDIDDILGLLDPTTLAGSITSGAIANGVTSLLGKMAHAVGATLTNPYVMIPLAILAALGITSYVIANNVNEANSKADALDYKIFGTSASSTEKKFSNFTNGESLSDYITHQIAKGDEKVLNELGPKIKDIYDAVVEETEKDIDEELDDKTTAAGNAANVGNDPNARAAEANETEKFVLTKRQYRWRTDDPDVYNDYMTASDLASLGGKNIKTADEASIKIMSDYVRYIKADYSETELGKVISSFDEDPSIIDENGNKVSITEFDYGHPLEMLKFLAIELSKIIGLEEGWDLGDTSTQQGMNIRNNKLNEIYENLFNDLFAPIGRDEKFKESLKFSSNSYWFRYRADLGTILMSSSGNKQEYIKKILNIFIPLSQTSTLPCILDIYYPDNYTYQDLNSGISNKVIIDNNRLVSYMTVAQQMQLLGNDINENGKLIKDQNKYYFLPIVLKVNSKTYMIDTELRRSLNTTGIVKSNHYLTSDDNYEYDPTLLGKDMDLTNELLDTEVSVQTQRDAYDKVAKKIDVAKELDIKNHYETSSVITGIIETHSGFNKESDEGRESITNLARELESYSYEELSEMKKNKKDSENYLKLLNLIPNSDSDALDTVLERTVNYIENGSYNEQDLIEYIDSKTNSKFTEADLREIRDKINKDETLIDDYLKIKNLEDGNNKNKEYKKFLENKLKISSSKFKNPQDIINTIDRIFKYVSVFNQYDEGGSDLDGWIASTLGITGDIALKDISSNVVLPGLGVTADQAIQDYGFSPQQIMDYLKLLTDRDDYKSFDYDVKVNDEGKYDVINNTNYDSEQIKKDLIQALIDSGLIVGMNALLDGQSILTNTEYNKILAENPNLQQYIDDNKAAGNSSSNNGE